LASAGVSRASDLIGKLAKFFQAASETVVHDLADFDRLVFDNFKKSLSTSSAHFGRVSEPSSKRKRIVVQCSTVVGASGVMKFKRFRRIGSIT
jgi:hypothetical protein